MKKILISIYFQHTFILIAQITPNSQWTWMKGDSISGVASIYGTQGIASNSNKPGARHGAVSWTDLSGNLWLFGGRYNTPSLIDENVNDLWKYTPSTNQWTYIKGGSGPIYGTKGIAATDNKPGGRNGAVSWTDNSGNLWLFGGYGLASNGVDELNDLWKYDPANNMWTWMKGDSISGVAGVYGTQGVASSANKPPARDGAVSWSDGLGNLWLLEGRLRLRLFLLKLIGSTTCGNITFQQMNGHG